MEDVLDVSAENLEQLKEEAAMVRDDTLMRYIRIFSELQNQIKYAGSKRVMLEVALIKLCRPQMEQDQLSVLERVRRLEKQLASGVVVRQQDTGGYTPEGNFDYQNPVNVAAPGGIDRAECRCGSRQCRIGKTGRAATAESSTGRSAEDRRYVADDPGTDFRAFPCGSGKCRSEI